MESLFALSPLDGRYIDSVKELQEYLSEYGLIRYRVKVEVEYFIVLAESNIIPSFKLSPEDKQQLRAIFTNFSIKDAQAIKSIEKITNHDVKAVEYFLAKTIREKFPHLPSRFCNFIHFGLTSQDINNTAIPLMLKDTLHFIIFPLLKDLISLLKEKIIAWTTIPMLARTHGQPASPTTLGKEIAVFYQRILNQENILLNTPIPAKFGGATGNFNAHFVAFPDYDWDQFAKHFIERNLGLKRNSITTQIDHYDGLAEIFDALRRINIILTDMCSDIWHYISLNYFKLDIVTSEIGSSTMPHKVNPIDFENAEGNLKLANAILSFLSEKLPVSRLQRDLTDSTVLRNLSLPFGYTLLSWKNIIKGFSKLQVNSEKLSSDLNENWAVLTEAIQTILRIEGYENAYEHLKEFARGQEVNQINLKEFIQNLSVDSNVKEKLLAVTPFNYIGNAAIIAQNIK